MSEGVPGWAAVRCAPLQNNWDSRRVESELWPDNLSGSSGDVNLATPSISIEAVPEADRGWGGVISADKSVDLTVFHLRRVPRSRDSLFRGCVLLSVDPPNRQAEPLPEPSYPDSAIPAPQSLFGQKQRPKLASFLSLEEEKIGGKWLSHCLILFEVSTFKQ